jgi:hypothetical protein
MTGRRCAAKLRRSLARALLGYGVGHAVLVCSCGTDDVVVATLPVDGGAGDETDCTSNDDCPPIAFCARERCGDARGVCQVRPFMCDPQGPPTCGCDGVSYWNDCLRQQYGESASTPGSCARGAATCTDESALDCPMPGAACAKLLPPNASCEGDAVGACWILPVDCPMGGPSERWSSCGDRPDCRDTCAAIRTGLPHRPDIMHQCPPVLPGR